MNIIKELQKQKGTSAVKTTGILSALGIGLVFLFAACTPGTTTGNIGDPGAATITSAVTCADATPMVIDVALDSSGNATVRQSNLAFKLCDNLQFSVDSQTIDGLAYFTVYDSAEGEWLKIDDSRLKEPYLNANFTNFYSGFSVVGGGKIDYTVSAFVAGQFRITVSDINSTNEYQLLEFTVN